MDPVEVFVQPPTPMPAAPAPRVVSAPIPPPLQGNYPPQGFYPPATTPVTAPPAGYPPMQGYPPPGLSTNHVAQMAPRVHPHEVSDCLGPHETVGSK